MTVGFYYLVPVWGKNHIDIFLNLSLPTQLSSNNFSDKTICHNSKYFIYTYQENLEAIKKNYYISKLCHFVKIEYVDLDCIDKEHTYALMSWCHNHGIKEADNNNCASVFWAPDFLYADGCVQKIKELVSEERRVIFTVGIRTKMEGIARDIEKYKTPNYISINSRELVNLTLNNLHQIANSSFWKTNDTNDMLPSNLFWPVKDEGLLCHAFHLHPLVVYPSIKHIPIEITVDDDYILKTCPDPSSHYIIKDSDELYICELSSQDRVLVGIKRDCIKSLAEWLENCTNKQHRSMVKEKIRIHKGILNIKAWTDVEEDAYKIVSYLLNLFTTIGKIQNSAKKTKKNYFFSNYITSLLGKFIKSHAGKKRPYVEKLEKIVWGSFKNPKISHPYWLFWKTYNDCFSFLNQENTLLIDYDSTSLFQQEEIKNQFGWKIKNDIDSLENQFDTIIINYGKNTLHEIREKKSIT